MQQLGNISKEKTEFLLFIPDAKIHTGQMVAEVKIFLIQIVFPGLEKKKNKKVVKSYFFSRIHLVRFLPCKRNRRKCRC